MKDIEVQFPKPCDEPWEDMTASGCNRHCAKCGQVIHDLAKMTGEDAGALLKDGGDVCVRAKIGTDGLVQLADSGKSGARKLRNAAVGATASLALAACATSRSPEYGFWVLDVSPASTVAGELSSSDTGSKVVLAGNGQTFSNQSNQPERYEFTDVAPGFYRLEIGEPVGYCDNQRVALVEVGEKQTFISRVEWRDNCIVVGKMTPVNPPERV